MKNSITITSSLKEFSTIFLGMFVIMSLGVFATFIALLPIFATMYYFARFNNAGGFIVMIGGYAIYFVIARKLGYLETEVDEFKKIWR